MSHSIKVWTKENLWFAEVILVTGLNETSAPYKIEAPSQTMLIELIRMVLRIRGKDNG